MTWHTNYMSLVKDTDWHSFGYLCVVFKDVFRTWYQTYTMKLFVKIVNFIFSFSNQLRPRNICLLLLTLLKRKYLLQLKLSDLSLYPSLPRLSAYPSHLVLLPQNNCVSKLISSTECCISSCRIHFMIQTILLSLFKTMNAVFRETSLYTRIPKWPRTWPSPLSENNSVQASFHLYLYLKQPFTYFSPIFHFYSHWKRLKTFAFLTFSGGIENGALG